eukprot:CAMPEP_0119270940 /NCGR_PEP_ID=MMETSP1329-20130426/7742_1 /TAXON_ID=114041 /ORGANISM="Genus nov. species nov., Strain RCC1024" /LENGTH=197 /DNA_ID=CAMNT_0007270977 /DNA_START=211 /DNA_END=801 /DNA_ORIENTATION=+
MALAARGFLQWYNGRLAAAPYSTKAAGTGLTYFCSDLTAQCIEGGSKPAHERAERALKFAAVGGLWVGPLLTAWFNVMDRVVPGRTLRPVAIKLVVDQVVQGPVMIASMFGLCALLNGATLPAVQRKIESELWGTWVASVYVWSPVQVVQQVFVPLQYRVAVANAVSYVWDTYLSLKMMPAPAEAGTPLTPLQRKTS